MARTPDNPGDYLFRRIVITRAGVNTTGVRYVPGEVGTIFRGTSLPALFVARMDNGKHPYLFCSEFDLIDEGDGHEA